MDETAAATQAAVGKPCFQRGAATQQGTGRHLRIQAQDDQLGGTHRMQGLCRRPGFDQQAVLSLAGDLQTIEARCRREGEQTREQLTGVIHDKPQDNDGPSFLFGNFVLPEKPRKSRAKLERHRKMFRINWELPRQEGNDPGSGQLGPFIAPEAATVLRKAPRQHLCGKLKIV
ncbi:hypothetical protein [Herbaspirillum huttiense]|uniref:Uncharacterized protein n=1 Tax=Herbaspirillum huttiense subsp. lycopersici TaxID=3074428 RepID=A0ABU2EVE3_9BURK|nr:hypothetical protein [Herbaspirillum huttiense]MDR9851808.1 hypothetical protein [Herbaspirillum huttiense SE1]